MNRDFAVRLRRVVGVVAPAVLAAGCFTYRAAEPAAIQPGEPVRLTLTATGTQEVTQQVGPRVQALDGRLIATRDSALAVSVSQVTRSPFARSPANEEFWPGDSVVVPVRGVESLQVRRLDRRRSVWAVGGALVGIFLLREVTQEAGLFGGGASRPPAGQ